MKKTITATYRDYNADLPEQGSFAISTTTEFSDHIVIEQAFGDTCVTVGVSADVARELGTSLLRWTGSPLTNTLQPVEFDADDDCKIIVEVLDGEVTIGLRDDDGTEIEFTMSDENVIDLAHRLIVRAGVKVAVDA